MDFGTFGAITFDTAFLWRLLTIIGIDLVLAGDNAVVIAMAVRSLPREQRRKGILLGAGAAVFLRVLATIFVSQMLQIMFLKLVGGILILWIALKLFTHGGAEEGDHGDASNIYEAVKIIAIADITMSLDNMLAVGGAADGNLILLLFGLGLSIPFLIFTSNLFSTLMDKYPIIIAIGAAILGKVGGAMIITDPVVVKWLEPSKLVEYGVEGFFAVAVVVVGKLWVKRMVKAEKNKNEDPAIISQEQKPSE